MGENRQQINAQIKRICVTVTVWAYPLWKPLKAKHRHSHMTLFGSLNEDDFQRLQTSPVLLLLEWCLFSNLVRNLSCFLAIFPSDSSHFQLWGLDQGSKLQADKLSSFMSLAQGSILGPSLFLLQHVLSVCVNFSYLLTQMLMFLTLLYLAVLPNYERKIPYLNINLMLLLYLRSSFSQFSKTIRPFTISQVFDSRIFSTVSNFRGMDFLNKSHCILLKPHLLGDIFGDVL